MLYECLECGEVVPEGCCTCGPRRRLRPVGVTCEFTTNPHVRARWDHVVEEERLRPRSLARQQAILAAARYITMLEAALQRVCEVQ